MIVHDVAQRSPEWYALRLGRLCGSRAADMLATRRDGTEAAGPRNLRIQLALERITGRSLERDYVSQAMQDGIAREEDALAAYQIRGRLVQPVGYVAHDVLMAGCSPDGVVGAFEGIVEAKCPIPATHWDFVRTGVIPSDYQAQIAHNLWITGAGWCDFLSYQPEFPEPLHLRVVRVVRDEAAIAAYAQKAAAFLTEVDREVEAIRTMADLGGTLHAAAGARA